MLGYVTALSGVLSGIINCAWIKVGRWAIIFLVSHKPLWLDDFYLEISALYLPLWINIEPRNIQSKLDAHASPIYNFSDGGHCICKRLCFICLYEKRIRGGATICGLLRLHRVFLQVREQPRLSQQSKCQRPLGRPRRQPSDRCFALGWVACGHWLDSRKYRKHAARSARSFTSDGSSPDRLFLRVVRFRVGTANTPCHGDFTSTRSSYCRSRHCARPRRVGRTWSGKPSEARASIMYLPPLPLQSAAAAAPRPPAVIIKSPEICLTCGWHLTLYVRLLRNENSICEIVIETR